MNIQIWPGGLTGTGASWTNREFKQTRQLVQDYFHYEKFNIERQKQ